MRFAGNGGDSSVAGWAQCRSPAGKNFYCRIDLKNAGGPDTSGEGRKLGPDSQAKAGTD